MGIASSQNLKQTKIELGLYKAKDSINMYDNFVFKLTNDISDPDYVFTHKLTKLMLYLKELAEKYEKQDPKYSSKFVPVLQNDKNSDQYRFEEVMVPTGKSDIVSLFMQDILQIISYICKMHNYCLKVQYTEISPLSIGTPGMHYLYIYTKLVIISEQDEQKLFEKINYIKVIPFDIRYCLRKNIKLPAKIKILITAFDFGVANEIAKYLYVICCK